MEQLQSVLSSSASANIVNTVCHRNVMKADEIHLCTDTSGTGLLNRSRNSSFKREIESKLTPPPDILILEQDFMPPAACGESRLEGKICYPSHKTTFVCLPEPSKPLTRLGSAQWQQTLCSLALSPSLFYSHIPSHFVLAHLPVQCRHSEVCLHLLSEGNLSTKPPYVGRLQWHA